MKEISKGIYVETGYRRITVGAVLTNEGWILIDTPPYPGDARDWRDALANEADRPFLFVINTDHHRDRMLGTQWFEARIVMHRAAADVTIERDLAYVVLAAEELAYDDDERADIACLRPLPPHVSYSDMMTIAKGGRAVTLTHMPGPTPGSTWVEFPEEQIVFVGDHIVTTTHPYMADSVSKAWLEALTRLRRDRYEGYRVVPGRGAVTKPDGSHSTSDYVRAARRRVHGLVRSGRPRADTAELIEGLLSEQPIRNGDREEIERRIKAGLEHIYDEIKAGDA